VHLDDKTDNKAAATAPSFCAVNKGTILLCMELP
jgi:hypothetical protein